MLNVNKRKGSQTILEKSRDNDCSLDSTRCQCFRSDCIILSCLKLGQNLELLLKL